MFAVRNVCVGPLSLPLVQNGSTDLYAVEHMMTPDERPISLQKSTGLSYLPQSTNVADDRQHAKIPNSCLAGTMASMMWFYTNNAGVPIITVSLCVSEFVTYW